MELGKGPLPVLPKVKCSVALQLQLHTDKGNQRNKCWRVVTPEPPRGRNGGKFWALVQCPDDKVLYIVSCNSLTFRMRQCLLGTLEMRFNGESISMASRC